MNDNVDKIDKNRHHPKYWLIQAAIAHLGENLSVNHWIIRRLVQFREDPYSLLDDSGEKTFNELLQLACDNAGISLEQLEEEARISYETLTKIETGSDDVEGV